jgi:ABC-type nitrate/sulfonate/bicarbonate transport system substrate-binding protein
MSKRTSRRTILLRAGIALAASAAATPAQQALAQGAGPLKVSSFAGLSNLPIFAAQQQDLFKKYGVAIALSFTPNSKSQREGLASGEYQIIHTAADNAVAMVELGKADPVIVAGGDNGFNRIFAQPAIKSLADLRGKTVVVDAPNTAFALLLYKALKEAGLDKGDYKVHPVGGTPQRLNAMLTDKANAAAGVINPPLSFEAAAAGLRDMGSATTGVGDYQSGSVVVMRPWAKANGDTLVRYLKAIIEGRRWLLDPANKNDVIALMASKFRLSPDFAAKSYAVVTDPTNGFVKDAKFNMQGFLNVLKLRAEIEGQWGGHPPAPSKYIDLSYYDTALAAL